MARYIHFTAYIQLLLAYTCHTPILTLSKCTKIELDSVMMILDDPRAPGSYNIYKIVEKHTK
ncbi:hypothetical protein F383_24027 [Gossypium arboreum]|uniref:Secreted protein n=1 Tax=Gossypium arboreum TaxID=29729 RepID=A0A0B0P423_GOSAR|nr:hypothetical protein F383_24027 [Gossypium arboreum]